MNVQELLSNPEKVEQICSQYFNSIDKNRNGVLEYREISSILAKFANDSNSIRSPENEIVDAFNQLDKNKDGKISYTEFKALFDKYLSSIAKK